MLYKLAYIIFYVIAFQCKFAWLVYFLVYFHVWYIFLSKIQSMELQCGAKGGATMFYDDSLVLVLNCSVVWQVERWRLHCWNRLAKLIFQSVKSSFEFLVYCVSILFNASMSGFFRKHCLSLHPLSDLG